MGYPLLPCMPHDNTDCGASETSQLTTEVCCQQSTAFATSNDRDGSVFTARCAPVHEHLQRCARPRPVPCGVVASTARAFATVNDRDCQLYLLADLLMLELRTFRLPI